MEEDAQLGGMQFGIIQIGPALIAIPIQHLSEVLHVQKQEPIAQGGKLLRGGIDLRGQVVPVLDLQTLAGLPEPDDKTKLGIIVEYQARLIAIFIDRVVGIATVSTSKIRRIVDTNGTQSSFFHELFAHDGSFASILDISATFGVPGVFTAKRADNSAKSVSRAQVPMLTFEAGSALFSVPAVEVYAAIPRQRIVTTAITMGDCLGEITYHGRRIPVVCASRITGLGDEARPTRPEIVALRFPGDHVLGLAVDAIHEIGTFSAVSETSVPLWQSGRNFIDRVIIRKDDMQIYVVDLKKLREADDLLTIAKLSKEEETDGAKPEKEISKKQNVSRERRRYLVVDTDIRLAIPLSQVNRIVEPVTHITPATAKIPGFRGYFSCLGESIALFDLAAFLGCPACELTTGKVLLTGQSGCQVGFVVQNVVSIETSEWREKPLQSTPREAMQLVQLGIGEETSVFPYFNIVEVIDEIRDATFRTK